MRELRGAWEVNGGESAASCIHRPSCAHPRIGCGQRLVNIHPENEVGKEKKAEDAWTLWTSEGTS